jgi:hypothetical protein
MEAYVLTVWLTARGPKVTTRVDSCTVGAVWYASALKWAERSGLPPDEPGWMCGVPYRPVSVWSVRR